MVSLYSLPLYSPLLSSLSNFQTCHKVSSLINPHTRNWDLDLLKALFTPEEARLIKSIPLGSASASDRVI